MGISAADVRALFSTIVSSAQQLGMFDRIIQHEPKSAPGDGRSLAIWAGDDTSIPQLSGLASTSIRQEFNARIYIPMLTEPQDSIEVDLLEADFALKGAWSAGFTLGGLAFEVDLLGAYGTPLSSKKGYINQDSRLYRISEIVCPVILVDVFNQAP